MYFYVLLGVGATASFYVNAAATPPVDGYGSILNVALAYAFGIVMALIAIAPTSGGHCTSPDTSPRRSELILVRTSVSWLHSRFRRFQRLPHSVRFLPIQSKTPTHDSDVCRKAAQYMLAQTFGAFLAALTVCTSLPFSVTARSLTAHADGIYKEQLDAIHATLIAAGPPVAELAFSSKGPAGVIALFVAPGANLSYVFLNEFIVNLVSRIWSQIIIR